ncbi:hypothetical protein AB6A40_008865 [Gnathostoma spinigerum]|uniref:Homeobox domain-containing protein n=1 Tax=Gnathostoma spinigerum TaxID=75299 RepID=A0ABD6ES56_9BILA
MVLFRTIVFSEVYPIDEFSIMANFTEADRQSQNLFSILRTQQEFRPITSADIHHARSHLRDVFSEAQKKLKEITANNLMIMKQKYMEKKRKRRNFSKEATQILSQYFKEHLTNPYPDEDAKRQLALRCHITVNQVTNWFGNKRIRSRNLLADAKLKAAKCPSAAKSVSE